MVETVYMAAKFSKREIMEDLSYRLPDIGMKCIAKWVYGGEEGLTREDIAILDVNDVLAADTIILFTEQYGSENPGGGRFVEFGIALAMKKRLIVIGDYEMVFCHYPSVEVYRDFDQFIRCHERVK